MSKCAGPFRHKWDECPAEGDADYGALCERCSSTRMVEIDMQGKVVKRRYKHSEAYKRYLKNRDAHVSQADLRLEWVEHLQAVAKKKRAVQRKRRRAHA